MKALDVCYIQINATNTYVCFYQFVFIIKFYKRYSISYCACTLRCNTMLYY